MSLREESMPRAGFLPQAVESLLRTWSFRLAALGLLALAAFVWVALLTWQAQTASNLHGAEGNAFGLIGSIISDLFIQGLGLVAVIAVLPLVFFAYELARHERVALASARLVFWPAGLFLLAGGFSAVPRIAAWPLAHGFGGFVGDFAFGVLRQVLDTIEPSLGGLIAGGLLFVGGIALLFRTLNLSPRDLLVVLEPAAQNSANEEPMPVASAPAAPVSRSAPRDMPEARPPRGLMRSMDRRCVVLRLRN